MRKLGLLLSAITLFMLSATALAGDAAPGGAPNGKDLFGKKCAMCHKADGTGNAAMPGTDLTKAAGDCVKIVTDGKGKMPAFKAKLSEAEIKAVCDHVASLKK